MGERKGEIARVKDGGGGRKKEREGRGDTSLKGSLIREKMRRKRCEFVVKHTDAFIALPVT